MNIRISKQIYLVIFSGALLLLTARCSRLEEKPRDFVGPDNYYNSPAQIESAFVSSMQRLWGGWQFYDWMGYPQWPFQDDQLTGSNLNLSDDWGNGSWTQHYQAIADINPAIKALNEDKLGTGVTQEVKDELMAQAKFLRAWNYFWLVRLYGDIPLILEDTDPVNSEITRQPVATVYDQIVTDMLYASQNLPDDWGEQKARPTADVAKGMLAKVYITMATSPMNDASKYVNARDMAKQVIDGHHYSLVPAVEDVFKLDYEFGPEFMFAFHNSPEEYVIEPEIYLPGNPLPQGWGDITPEQRFGLSYPEEPRKGAYLLLADLWYGTGTTYLDWDGQKPYIRKYLYDAQENLEKSVSYQPFPLLRYADVLLLFAEAENMASGGPTQAAVDAVNQIVNRATGGVPNPDDPLFTTSMSKEQFDAAVIHQRSLELCFEYDRWFDIQRKRILYDVSDPVYQPNITDDDYLLAIPQKDLRLNKKLTQNPGYSDPNGQ